MQNLRLKVSPWDRAIVYAESVGKRLPDEYEYESAATANGRLKFPWGNDSPADATSNRGPVTETSFDRLASNPQVLGLYSNVAEWTSSPGMTDPSSPLQKQQLAPINDEGKRICV